MDFVALCVLLALQTSFSSHTEEESADFCLKGAFLSCDHASPAQCTIVHKCCTDPGMCWLTFVAFPPSCAPIIFIVERQTDGREIKPSPASEPGTKTVKTNVSPLV